MAGELINPRVRKIEGVSVVYSGVGNAVTNDDLLRKFASNRQSEKEAESYKTALDGSGIVLRYRPDSLYRDAPHLLEPEIIGATTNLTKLAMRSLDWTRADLLIGVSTFPPDKESRWVREVADKCGITNIGEVNAACNGGVLALVELLKNPAYRKSRVLVTAFEPLGRFTDPADFMSQVIFGSGGAAMAFEPERFEVFGAKTIVSKDEEGVIKVPKAYDIDHSPDPISSENDWFTIEPGSEEIVQYNKNRVRVGFQEPIQDELTLEMDGKKTGAYFTGLAKRTLIDALSNYQKYGIDPVNNPIEFIAGHQPSKPVFDHVGKKFGSEMAKSPGLAGIRIPEMPWILDKAEISNISSGTALVACGELLERVKEGKPFILLGYGVGATASWITARYR